MSAVKFEVEGINKIKNKTSIFTKIPKIGK